MRRIGEDPGYDMDAMACQIVVLGLLAAGCVIAVLSLFGLAV